MSCTIYSTTIALLDTTMAVFFCIYCNLNIFTYSLRHVVSITSRVCALQISVTTTSRSKRGVAVCFGSVKMATSGRTPCPGDGEYLIKLRMEGFSKNVALPPITIKMHLPMVPTHDNMASSMGKGDINCCVCRSPSTAKQGGYPQFSTGVLASKSVFDAGFMDNAMH